MADCATDVVVVGAGIVGCAVAYYLSLEGLNVRLMDRSDIGSGCSAHGTGAFSMLGGEFRPGASFSLGLEGLRMSGELADRLAEETGMETYYQRLPHVRMALDEEEEAVIRKMLAWQSAEMDARWIGGDDVLQMDSRLTPEIRGAALEQHSAQVDSHRFTSALARGAEKHGASIHHDQVTGIAHDNRRVTGVTYDGGTVSSEHVVLAMGPWAGLCQQWLDFPIPVRPLKGERLRLEFDGPPVPGFLTSPKRGHILTCADGFWSVGSTGGRDYDRVENFLGEDFDRTPTEEAKQDLLSNARTVLKDLKNARVVQHLAGSRPASADRLPIIGPVPGWEGVYMAVGHTTKGIHLSPITARIIRDYIVHGGPRESFDVSEFMPDRFSEQWEPVYQSARSFVFEE